MHIGTSFRERAAVAVIAIASGVLGSVLYDLIKPKPTTIRAERFELLDPPGRLVSFWGPDGNHRIPSTSSKGALLVFEDPHGRRRCQIGSRIGDYGPELMFYGADGPSDKPERFDSVPRVSIGLGGTGSPMLNMRGTRGDQMTLGAMYGDVPGEPEGGWGISFRAWDIQARAAMGYRHSWDGSYQSGITLSDGRGKSWNAAAGELRPLPLLKRPNR